MTFGWWEQSFGRSPNQFVRQDVERIYDKHCTYCGRPRRRRGQLTCDHVIPVSQGGKVWPDNLVPCCRDCNHSKGSMRLSEWRRKLAAMSAINCDGLRGKRKKAAARALIRASRFLIDGKIVFWFERTPFATWSPVLETLAKEVREGV